MQQLKKLNLKLCAARKSSLFTLTLNAAFLRVLVSYLPVYSTDIEMLLDAEYISHWFSLNSTRKVYLALFSC